jgi:molecular chaperone DnaJ
VPEGTQSGKLFRISGKGFPNVHNQGAGDFYIRVLLETPVKLSEKQQSLLRTLEELASAQNYPSKKGFFDKVKAFFA